MSEKERIKRRGFLKRSLAFLGILSSSAIVTNTVEADSAKQNTSNKQAKYYRSSDELAG